MIINKIGTGKICTGEMVVANCAVSNRAREPSMTLTMLPFERMLLGVMFKTQNIRNIKVRSIQIIRNHHFHESNELNKININSIETIEIDMEGILMGKK